MGELKLNKTELKNQKTKLEQLTKYLPTLQLKKQQLQVEVDSVATFIEELRGKLEALLKDTERWAILYSQKLTEDVHDIVKLKKVITDRENIAGVDVPVFKDVEFEVKPYSFFMMPTWLDTGIVRIKEIVRLRENIKVAEERKALLEEELRQTNIKVNLFEKRLIPECKENIRKIKIFLGDQEIAAICNAKIAKDKLKKKEMLSKQKVRQLREAV